MKENRGRKEGRNSQVVLKQLESSYRFGEDDILFFTAGKEGWLLENYQEYEIMNGCFVNKAAQLDRSHFLER